MNSIDRLMKRLKELGFGNMFTSFTEMLADKEVRGCGLFKIKKEKGDETSFSVDVSHKPGGFVINSYEITVKKAVAIPDQIINGIDPVKLDRRMASVEWPKERALDYRFTTPGVKSGRKRRVDNMIKDVFRLYHFNEAGKDVSERLQAKHWMATNFNEFVQNYDRLYNRYIVSQKVDIGVGKDIPVSQALSELNKAAELNKIKQDKRTASIFQKCMSINQQPGSLLLKKTSRVGNKFKLGL